MQKGTKLITITNKGETMKKTPIELLIFRLNKMARLHQKGEIESISLGDVIREAEKLKSKEFEYYFNAKHETLGWVMDSQIEKALEAQKEKA